ncbi:MAG: ParA family protein [Thiotrichales bacterium]|nr:MAG: ParA family protein [Thiotrichales bacterium]
MASVGSDTCPQRITIINVKGGCGKTTVATNLASAYASLDMNTALLDFDPQGSSMYWLKARPLKLPKLHGIAAYRDKGPGVTRSFHLRLPHQTERVIIDTPAGLTGLALIDQLRGTDTILIPVLPSSIDIHATADFIRDLFLIAKVRPQRTRVCIICNRVKPNTLSFRALERFLHALDIPVIAQLRETQNYVMSSEIGLGVHELDNKSNQQDIDAWQKLISWLEFGKPVALQ